MLRILLKVSIFGLFQVALAHASECLDTELSELRDCLENSGWEHQVQTSNIDIYSRSSPGSSVREVRATTLIQATVKEIHTVLIDFDRYTNFMPETLEHCELIHREGKKYWVFQQLKLPLVSDRFYTIKLESKHLSESALQRIVVWQLADEAEYQRSGKGQKSTLNNGYWSLREQANDETLVQYYIHTDPGHLWSWVVNIANSVAVPDVVKALRQHVEKTEK